MSENIIPEVVTSDVPESVETAVNYSEMNLAELIRQLDALVSSEDKLKRGKEVEAIKSAFYKRLLKEKAENPVEDGNEHPLNPVENSFKEVYDQYKKERSAYAAQLEAEREENLRLKEQVILDIKALMENQEDVSAHFADFRKLQEKWRSIGPVPVKNYEDINRTYQHNVELFYDMVGVNRELRDLDFQKNLEAKQQFCELAEKLSENENVIEAFKELQKLHEQWKELGPVAKQYRDEIWDRFKAATAVINKKYQSYFEGLKEQHAENLVKKTALCEKVEAIADKEEITSSNEWNALSKEIEDIQKEWKTIGFASKKENQKIYDRFRAACDKFYERKRVFYTDYKGSMNANLEKKIQLCELAEQLKSSTEWKKATDQFINLQKQWKEIGAVPRKKSEQLWKRFRAAADEFFAERDKNAKPENDFYGNLKAKQRLIEEIKAYTLSGDEDADMAAMTEFMQKWQNIGFVPFKEKEKIQQAYKDALAAAFPGMSSRSRKAKTARQPKSEREILVQKYNKLEQDIVTYENNIGFFAMSKNSEPLIKQMEERIAQAKEELKALENQIRSIDAAES